MTGAPTSHIRAHKWNLSFHALFSVSVFSACMNVSGIKAVFHTAVAPQQVWNCVVVNVTHKRKGCFIAATFYVSPVV